MLMTKRILLGTLVLLCALALVTPASAVTVNGTDWVLLAKTGILMEQSDDCPHILDPANLPPGKVCMNIVGNVGVSDVGTANPAVGRLQIGAKNDIVGLARAHNIVFATGSETDTCNFDITSGIAPAIACHTFSSPALLPIVAAWPPGPLGAVPVEACVNVAANVTVAIGATLNLAPGCYKDVRVNAGGTLNLAAGLYNFKTLRLIAGATLNGASVTTTTVNVQSLTISEAGANWNDVFIKTPGSVAQSVTEFINIGNGNHLKNVVLYAPTAAIHLHLGTTGSNIEAVANFITVEPVILNNVPLDQECACFGGPVSDFLNGNTLSLIGGHGLNLPGNKFFLSPSCDPAAGVDITAKLTSPPTDDTATFDLTGVTTTNQHVLVQSTAGTFCSADTLP